MYRVTAWFRDKKVTQVFSDLYDAIEYKDTADAHYPNKLTFEKDVFSMREFIHTSWHGVMNHHVNPLKHIPDLQVRHMVLQVLAWMWCIVFAFIVGDLFVFGVSAVAHILLLGAITVTVATFETAKRRPQTFNFNFHTPSRTRGYMWVNGQKIKLDKNDPGGEHE